MKNKKGFTLVEVIISIAALGIICAVLLRLFVLAGNTNNKAADMQSASLVVTSTVETLVGADTLPAALDTLGLHRPDSVSDVIFDFERSGYDMVLEVHKKGDYPGTFYEVSVKAESGGKTLASLSTAKYYKEETND